MDSDKSLHYSDKLVQINERLKILNEERNILLTKKTLIETKLSKHTKNINSNTIKCSGGTFIIIEKPHTSSLTLHYLKDILSTFFKDKKDDIDKRLFNYIVQKRPKKNSTHFKFVPNNELSRK